MIEFMVAMMVTGLFLACIWQGVKMVGGGVVRFVRYINSLGVARSD